MARVFKVRLPIRRAAFPQLSWAGPGTPLLIRHHPGLLLHDNRFLDIPFSAHLTGSKAWPCSIPIPLH
jgi:hypothetical protein